MVFCCIRFSSDSTRRSRFSTISSSISKMGSLVDRVHRELSDEEIEDNGMPFEEKMVELTATLGGQCRVAQIGERDSEEFGRLGV